MFVEFIFFLANNITDDYIGFSIVLLSVAVNVICLPIYNVAEGWQEKERNIQKKLKPKVNDIKAVFSGDERYMILSAYYRQNHYHPVYAMRGMFALLIQIPFFIAAYKHFADSNDTDQYYCFRDLFKRIRYKRKIAVIYYSSRFSYLVV